MFSIHISIHMNNLNQLLNISVADYRAYRERRVEDYR